MNYPIATSSAQVSIVVNLGICVDAASAICAADVGCAYAKSASTCTQWNFLGNTKATTPLLEATAYVSLITSCETVAASTDAFFVNYLASIKTCWNTTIVALSPPVVAAKEEVVVDDSQAVNASIIRLSVAIIASLVVIAL